MRKLLFASILVLFALTASAATLSVTPVSQTIEIGGLASVIVSIDHTVGDFDIVLGWDPTVVTPLGSDLFPQLGVPGVEADFGWVYGASEINAWEVSLLDVTSLLALQPGPTTNLFSVTFKGVAAGVSPISLAVYAIGDEYGEAIEPLTLAPGEIRVKLGGTAEIPEPATITLLAAGLAALLTVKAVRRR